MRIKNQKGNTAVEFAIVFPLLVVFIFGIVEFSLILYDKVIITNASREGTRSGTLARYKTIGTNIVPDPLSEDEIKTIVNSYCSTFLITFGTNKTITTKAPLGFVGTPPNIDRNGDGILDSGDDRVVQVSYTYTFLVLPNFVSSLIGGINLVATTTMRME